MKKLKSFVSVLVALFTCSASADVKSDQLLVFHMDFNIIQMRRDLVMELLNTASKSGYNAILWEIENKIENGTLVELPCKVWDTVYMPWEFDGNCGIAILSVEEIEISRQSIFTNLESDDLVFLSKYNCGVFYFDEVGTKVFLTKAEAEAKLKELQGDRE